MSDLADLESAIIAACEKARADGLEIVCGTYRQFGTESGECLTGVCAVEALGMYDPNRLMDDASRVLDSVAQGFDAQPRRSFMLQCYYELGLRLRAKLRPRET